MAQALMKVNHIPVILTKQAYTISHCYSTLRAWKESIVTQYTIVYSKAGR